MKQTLFPKLWWRTIVLMVVLAGTRTAGATSVFLVDADGFSYNTVFQVDQSNGQLTPVVSLNANLGEVLGLAAASDNLLYAVSEGGGGAVIAITVNTATASILGFIGNNSISGLAMSSSGTLYAIDEATNSLSTIQIAPSVSQSAGVVLRVGSTAGPVFDVQGGDLAQDSLGNWYLWQNTAERLYSLDVTLGVVTQLGTGSTLGKKAGLAFDYDGGGTLLASSGALDQLLRLNPANGTTNSALSVCVVGSCPATYNLQFGDMASAFPVVPLPPAVWLFGSALGLMGWLRRKAAA